jgi:YfiH family protein
MDYIQAEWPAPSHIKAYTTVRDSWGDRHHLLDNDRLMTLLQLPAEPIWLKQTHTALAVSAELSNIGQEADASFTSARNRVCAVLTADCLPLFICDQAGTQVAAIHAGWRGLANGIIESTLSAFKQPRESLLVWLGPAIGPQKFEVGSDVYEAFTRKDAASEAGFKPHTPGKWLADLYTLAKIRLTSMGITQVYGGQFCTYSQPDLFYSYRRDKGQTGRMASLIWIAAN